MYYINVMITVILFLLINHILIFKITSITSNSDLKKVFTIFFFQK